MNDKIDTMINNYFSVSYNSNWLYTDMEIMLYGSAGSLTGKGNLIFNVFFAGGSAGVPAVLATFSGKGNLIFNVFLAGGSSGVPATFPMSGCICHGEF